ncbi:MAG TPA: putative glycolipid-binding domain-containing protein [Chthoniobacterales bacterium]|nr:putative glycolipid-binding domain-containing protein [Chthoniobacterales bacterium]
MSASSHSCTVIWRRGFDSASFELFRFIGSRTGYHFNGTIIAAHQNLPLEVCYQVRSDPDWKTQEVMIQQRNRFAESNLKLVVHDGVWEADPNQVSELIGSIDVDIEFTPATNALPINRLGLAIGESAEIQAAWIRIPTLAIVPAKHRYERLSENTYRYTSIASGFQAEIEVDRFGLPIRYGNIWQRIAAAEEPRMDANGF